MRIIRVSSATLAKKRLANIWLFRSLDDGNVVE